MSDRGDPCDGSLEELDPNLIAAVVAVGRPIPQCGFHVTLTVEKSDRRFHFPSGSSPPKSNNRSSESCLMIVEIPIGERGPHPERNMKGVINP